MKRVLLLGLSAITLMAGTTVRGWAQPQLGFLSSAYVGASLAVTAPASIAGGKQVTNSFASGWGGNPDTATIVNAQVVKAGPDSLACNPITTPVAGKVALVFRGSCEFGAKALSAQNAGARAVIIVNNSGAPVGMGAGAVGSQVTIPVFMVSTLDGEQMNLQLLAGQNVTVTYAKWSFGLANDVGITPGSIVLPHAQAMPLSQLGTNNGSPLAYRNYVGAFVGNFGTATQTNVKLRSTTMWMPSTGSSMVVRRDSITNASFAPIDSIKDAQFLSTTSYQLNPTTTGTYRFIYELSAAAADGNLSNNKDSVQMLVTDSVFSKAGWNPATGNLIVSGGRGYVGNATPATMGPLFYVAKPNYKAAKVQFSIGKYNAAGADPLLNGTPDVFITIYKWTDGRNGAPVDSIIEGSELRPVAQGVKSFAVGDSSYETYTVDMSDYSDDTKPAILNEAGWYWVAVTTDNSTQFPGVARLNYFSRTAAAQRATPFYREFWAPMVDNGNTGIDTTSTTDSLRMFLFSLQPFTRITDPYTDPNSAAFTYTNLATPPSEDYAPAVAMHISKDTVAVTVGVPSTGTSAFSELELFPNPAKTTLNVRFDLAARADRVTFHILNSLGQSVRTQTLSDVNFYRRACSWTVLPDCGR